MLIWNEGRGHKLTTAPYLCLNFRRTMATDGTGGIGAMARRQRNAATEDSTIRIAAGDDGTAMPTSSAAVAYVDDLRECAVYADEVTAEATRSVCTDGELSETANRKQTIHAQITRLHRTCLHVNYNQYLHKVFGRHLRDWSECWFREKCTETTRCGRKRRNWGVRMGVGDVVDLRADTLSTSQSSGDGTARSSCT